MSAPDRRRRVAITVVTTLALAACANTIDPEAAPPPVDATTVTEPYIAAGATADLLDDLVNEAASLSEAIVDGDGQHEIIRRIDTIWATVKADVEAAAPTRTYGQFEAALELLHRGVERRRPADADKATINLRNLVAALDLAGPDETVPVSEPGAGRQEI